MNTKVDIGAGRYLPETLKEGQTVKVIICGHGVTTKGKGNLYGYKEWRYVRQVAEEWSSRMVARKEPHVVLNLGPCDISLKVLVKTADYYHKLYNGRTAVINLHTNAATRNGEWHDAEGCTVFYISEAGRKMMNGFGHTLNAMTGIKYRGMKKAKFWNVGLKKWWYLYMVKKPKAVAALIELGFHTNQNDIIKLTIKPGIVGVVGALEAHRIEVGS